MVWSIRASISVTITNIWTKFGAEHKYHTINTPEWPNSYKLKIQDGGGLHLEFQKMSITLDWIKISCIKLYGKMHHGNAEMTTFPKNETWSSLAWRHQMKVWSICVSICDYNRYLNQILYRTQIPHYQYARMAKFTSTDNSRWRQPPSWISEKCQ